MPDLDENQTSDPNAQPMQDEMQDQQAGQKSMKDKAGDMANKAKGNADVTGDGKFDAEDMKKMGEDAVNKVKGMFKKNN